MRDIVRCLRVRFPRFRVVSGDRSQREETYIWMIESEKPSIFHLLPTSLLLNNQVIADLAHNTVAQARHRGFGIRGVESVLLVKAPGLIEQALKTVQAHPQILIILSAAALPGFTRSIYLPLFLWRMVP